MEKIYFYTGLITFWLIVVLAIFVALWLLAALFWQKVWRPYRTYFWVFQVYEYLMLSSRMRRLKAKSYADVEWSAVLDNLALIEGRIIGREYRKRHLFQKRIVAILEEVLSSDAAPEWVKKKARITNPINF